MPRRVVPAGARVLEAHNLVERARDMYSASVTQGSLQAARACASGDVRKALEKVHRALGRVRKAHAAAEGGLQDLPVSFLTALRDAVAAIEAELVQDAPAAAGNELQQAYFDMLAFLRLVESFGTHSVLETHDEPARGRRSVITLRIQNLVPAPFLKPRFAAARTVTLFSATLNPPRYPMDMLGMPQDTAWIDVASPFKQEQLEVRAVRGISTRYADRQRSAAPIASLMAQQFTEQPGNYLAFFSSFEYPGLVAAEVAGSHPGIPMWVQVRGMDEMQRSEFIERDEQLKHRLEATFGAGYDYTYLYPGLQKVVRAAGRVIRTHEDRGIVYLIDDRFARPAVRALLPAWWKVASV
ncbi:hypothetical protein JJB11_13900 [Ramlibacter ginsenosidimutans]|uniref:ATP-dependent helicase C-terminal domain-containing protein n=1 Tax=Ramlibacter ginsenosidimutans TaxID=502333 RepID=A0A934WLW3_9BURK|nr:hypothetical protein [Ramlibacter ginsenosidimutans]